MAESDGRPLPRELVSKIKAFLRARGVRGYIVGGCVRDSLLGRACGDVDIAVDGPALELAREFATSEGGSFVPLDEVHAIARVVLSPGGEVVDFSSLRGDIEGDIAERDFTIDAMALSLDDMPSGPDAFPVIDPLAGHVDLREKRIRAVSDSIFEDDPGRLLRAVRLAAEYGFTIDHDTEGLIQRHAPLAGRVAGERTREELVRLLGLSRGATAVFDLDRLGLLEALLPELTAARGVQQPPEHHWDVFNHSLRTVEAVEALIERWEMGGGGGEPRAQRQEVGGGRWSPPTSHVSHLASDISPLTSHQVLAEAPWSDILAAHFGQTVGVTPRRALVKLAALLHDVAKPQTRSVEPTGRIRFLGHGQQGAGVAVAVLERWRFSNREIKLVETMVLHHLRPTQMAQGDELPSQHAIYRYFRDVGDAAVDTLFLSLADHWASRGPTLTLEGWAAHVSVVKYLLAEHFKQEQVSRPLKLVDGHDLMAAFGLKPGPALGRLLEALTEAQATGEIATRGEALAWVKRQLQIGGG